MLSSVEQSLPKMSWKGMSPVDRQTAVHMVKRAWGRTSSQVSGWSAVRALRMLPVVAVRPLDLPVAFGVVAGGVCDLDARHPAKVCEELAGELPAAVRVDGFQVSEPNLPVQGPHRLLRGCPLQGDGGFRIGNSNSELERKELEHLEDKRAIHKEKPKNRTPKIVQLPTQQGAVAAGQEKTDPNTTSKYQREERGDPMQQKVSVT